MKNIYPVLFFIVSVLLFTGCKEVVAPESGETVFDTYTFKFLTTDDDLVELSRNQIIAFMKDEIGNEPRDFDLVYFEIIQNPENESEYALLAVSEDGSVSISASLEKNNYGYRLTGKTCECHSTGCSQGCDAEIWSGECSCTPCENTCTKTSAIKTESTAAIKSIN